MDEKEPIGKLLKSLKAEMREERKLRREREREREWERRRTQRNDFRPLRYNDQEHWHDCDSKSLLSHLKFHFAHSLTLSHTHTLSLTLSHTLTLSLTLTHTLSLVNSLALKRTLFLSHSFLVTQTLTLSTHTCCSKHCYLKLRIAGGHLQQGILKSGLILLYVQSI